VAGSGELLLKLICDDVDKTGEADEMMGSRSGGRKQYQGSSTIYWCFLYVIVVKQEK
jgi:hypothetical protein